MQADETGAMALGVAFDVAQDDTLQLRVRVDSPIDLKKIEWTPSMFYVAPPDGPAPTHTIDGNTVTIDRVSDGAGNPLIQLHPPYDIDFYPVDGLSAPQNPWIADDDATVTVSSHLIAAPTASGIVFMTAKRNGELIAKRTIFIANGVVQNRQVDIDVEEDDRIFFDYSCHDPDLAPLVGHRVIEVDGDAVPSAFHTTARQGVFPLAYRGWGVAGYNGNPPRDTVPIDEAELDRTFDEDSEVDPRTDRAYLFTPFPEAGVWRGPEEETFATGTGLASSRLGPNSIPDPTGAGSSGRAPFRLSSSLQTAGELGVALLSGSTTIGGGGSDVDFMDMNGDQFPDVVARERVQFSPAIGGLEGASRGVSGLEAPRKTESIAGNVGVGGSPANFSVGSRGQVDSPGRGGAPKENNTGSQMVSLGLSGGLGAGTSSVPFELTDMNGDGLPDRVTESGGVLRVAFNLGYAFAPPETWGAGVLNEGSSVSASIGTNLGFNGGIYDYAGGVSLSHNASETTAMLTDINGDGLTDRVKRDGDRLLVGLNTGNAFLPNTEWGGAPSGAFATNADSSVGGGAYFTLGIGPVCLLGGCWVILNPGLDGSTSLARQESALMDLDGDGDLDHVQSDDESELVVARNTTGRTNLLRSIARPLGATITIDYERHGNTPDLPQSHWDMARVTIEDGLAGDGVDRQVATFRYEGGTWDRLEREFYGYARVTEEIRDTTQADAILRTITRDFAVDSLYTHGLLLRERLEDGAGRPFTETEHRYDVIDVASQAPLANLKSTTASAFAAATRTERRFFEGLPAPGLSTVATQEFDAVGNVVRTTDSGDPGAGDDVDAVYAYSPCPAEHVLGVAVGITVRGNGSEMRRRDAAIDCATGEITRITQYLANGTGSESLLEYDAFGNLTRIVDPPNRNGQRYQLAFEYDPVVHTYPIKVTDSFGLVSTTMFDFALGKKTATRDINGQRTTLTYDAHGRLTTMRGPYEQSTSLPTVRFEYHPEGSPPWTLTRHLDTFRNPQDPIDAVRFIDGLKRNVQEKTDASIFLGGATTPADAMIVSGRLTFDAVGRVTEKRYPVVEPLGTPGIFRALPDTIAPTRTIFDVLDRPTRVTEPDGTTTTSAYGFGVNQDGATQFETRNVDAKGASSFSYKNLREQVTSIKNVNHAGAGIQEIWTSYDYDALKQLIQIRDDHGNATRMVWDNLARKTTVDSPDEGKTEDAYDLAGNRVARTTANLRAEGRQITYDYEFNRLKSIQYPDFPGNRVDYTYGAPGAVANGAGRITRIADASGLRERSYGKLGEIVSEVRTIASTIPSGPHVYTTQYTYDSFDRLQSLIYPDGEVLTLRYDAGGRVRNITGHKGAFDYEYLRRMEYDKFGEQAFVEAGNGTRTTSVYRPDDRRLGNVVSTRVDGRPFVNLTYAYDAVGNVLSRTNNVSVATGSDFGGPSQQTFVYDDLDRMTSSHGTYEFAPRKIDRYVVAFDYDTIHNMTSRSQVHEIVQPSGSTITQGKTSYALAYAYGGPQPHGATHVGDRTFAFDANGNQAGWQNDRNGTRRNIVWDEENRMRSLFDNGHEIRYVYDDKGERVIKRGPQGETVYVNPWLTVRNGTIGTKHVWAGPMRVTSKLMKQNALEKDRYFYHPDHTGTTNFVSDSAGQMYEHLEYFPFGETWVQESTNTQRTPYAFTGKELDEETGLTYFGARFHDPRLGSFNSGDPMLFAKPEKGRDDPKFLSVYSYGNQNPEKFLDPDGREVIIVIGQDNGKSAESKIIQAGWPAAAKALQAKLAAGDSNKVRTIGKIASRIVTLDDKSSAADQIRAAADAIIGGGGTVQGLVYIGHGDPTTGLMVPTNTQMSASVREFVDAARLGQGAAFYTYGCEVSVSDRDRNHLQMVKGVDVYTTNGQWTWTHSGGSTGLGTSKKVNKSGYGNIYDLHMRNIINGVKVNRRCMTCDPEPSMHEGLAEAENAIQ
ncbi:MAG TPA: RHS repeat-associated core domain-containing protein [Candidatus Polarisedimenticolaceae bacterium]|nr:RHS repeat-associated core domain-containing protein [Candidatus Polarisedimenticolaceae bacterium]